MSVTDSDSDSDGRNKVLMGSNQSLHFCRSRNFIRAVKLDRVTFWNVSEHLRTEHRIRAPQHGSSCQHGTSTQSIFALPCVPVGHVMLS